ncbi:SIMPL domain-containing protein [Alteraurantiacibacter palmitatis]|uniref:SIMPL domain-containing protein n=1 Tax=Alteraurantiacibacter palmitatis TaxID=2054628 RepID=A0ABV7E503_9SPHN
MTRIAHPLAAAVLAASLGAAPASAAEVQMQVTGPVVELAVTEAVPSAPDMVMLDAGVTTQNVSATAAMAANARAMNAVIARIAASGVARDDIQTSGISLQPEYEWDEATRAQRFSGYRVSNRVQVKLRAIDRTGEVLDALVAAGATDLGGINFALSDPAAAQDQARVRAMATAQERAMRYAGLAGYTGLRLLEVSENVEPFFPQPMLRTVSAQAEAAPTPVLPGQVQSGVTVTVKYEMTR